MSVVRFLFLFVLLSMLPMGGMASGIDSLLRELDVAIAEKSTYDQRKEEGLLHLKSMLEKCTDQGMRFDILGQLFDEYLYYNTDSAHHYAMLRFAAARSSGNIRWIQDGNLNIAAVKIITGMYKEALDILNSVDTRSADDYIKLYNYQLYSSIYEAMHLYALSVDEKNHYLSLSDAYRDSILSVAAPGSADYFFNTAHRLINEGNCIEASNLLTNYYSSIETCDRNKAIASYILFNISHCLGNKDDAVKYLTISAICDIRSSTKEYMSLWMLAEIIYDSGNLERAYNYLKCSLEDASFSKARLRTIKITELFSVIESAYQKQRDVQQRRMTTMMVVISILLVVVGGAVVFSRRQIQKLRIAQSELAVANIQLNKLNDELEVFNSQLVAMNQSLTVTSAIKEEYIGRYMELCTVYLDKMDEYRRTLSRKAATGSIQEVINDLKSTQFIKNELKEFYNSFDHTFLKLFPTFIDDFNALLSPHEQVVLKPNEILNSELRVFALVRLGITDSEKIARFLRYSVTTIYNYRTKMRNKAAGNRNEFDDKVMRIGG